MNADVSPKHADPTTEIHDPEILAYQRRSKALHVVYVYAAKFGGGPSKIGMTEAAMMPTRLTGLRTNKIACGILGGPGQFLAYRAFQGLRAADQFERKLHLAFMDLRTGHPFGRNRVNWEWFDIPTSRAIGALYWDEPTESLFGIPKTRQRKQTSVGMDQELYGEMISWGETNGFSTPAEAARELIKRGLASESSSPGR